MCIYRNSLSQVFTIFGFLSVLCDLTFKLFDLCTLNERNTTVRRQYVNRKTAIQVERLCMYVDTHTHTHTLNLEP